MMGEKIASIYRAFDLRITIQTIIKTNLQFPRCDAQSL